MIAEGQVVPDQVEYNDLPWKYAAGTPNILGVIVSAQALRLPARPRSDAGRPAASAPPAARRAPPSASHEPGRRWNPQLTNRALDGLGPSTGSRSTGPAMRPAHALVAFNLAGRDPSASPGPERAGVESRAGCHCATLAHHDLGLTPPASCRLSF